MAQLVIEKRNLLKTSILQCRRSIGIWCSLANALATEVVGGSGADWLLIDCEHSPNDLRSVVAQLQAVAQFPLEPVVRLPSDSATVIKGFMDAGARSLMIPNVKSAAQAREIVAAMRYAPGGIRGYSARHRANQFGRIQNYHENAAVEQLLIVQIECPQGVANASEIAAVEGVDVLFLGPGDLSANVGELGNPAAASVQDAMGRVVEAAAAAGKVSGILAPVKSYADQYLAMGVLMVAVGSDVSVLATGSDALVRAFREEDK
jgi:2-keto-3-deoxy-L-rhamnonate aldolase RhmA